MGAAGAASVNEVFRNFASLSNYPLGYTEDVVENAMSINNGNFTKSCTWLLEHCVRDHSDESDEDDGMIDSYGDRVAFDDDSD